MAESLDLSGTECITVAVRRERLIDAAGNNLLDFIDTEPLHAAAQHGRLLHGRRRGPRRPAGPRDSARPGKPRRRLGEARSAGRQEDAAARSGRHARGDRAAGGRRLSGAVLHHRRPDHRPAAEGGRRDQRHARRQPHRLRPGHAQPQQHPHLPGVPQGRRSRLPGDRRRRRRHGQRRRRSPWSWASTACCSTRASPTPATRCAWPTR